jgi:hypothetical protein
MNCCEHHKTNCNQGRRCPSRPNREESTTGRLLALLVLAVALISFGLSLAGYSVQ